MQFVNILSCPFKDCRTKAPRICHMNSHIRKYHNRTDKDDVMQKELNMNFVNPGKKSFWEICKG